MAKARRNPDFIRRGGVVYQKTPASLYQEAVAAARREAEDLRYPPPTEVGVPLSPFQRVVLHRIAGRPSHVFWSGLRYGGSESELGLPYRSVAVLWRRGLLMRGNVDGTVRVGPRGQRLLIDSRVAYERLRWRAIDTLFTDLAGEKIAWSARWQIHYHENGPDPGPTPRAKPTVAMITARMRELREAERAAG